MKICINYTFAITVFILLSFNSLWAQDHTNTSDDLKRVKALIQDFDSLYTVEPARARALILQAIQTSKENRFLAENAECQYRFGKLLMNIGKSDSAQQSFEHALSIYQEIRDVKGVSKCYKDLGNVFLEKGKQETALQYYIKGLAMAKQNRWKELEDSFINNIGIVYLHQEHYDKAQQYFEESAALHQEGPSYAVAIYNIGIVKLKQGKLEEAIARFQQSLDACRKAEDEYCSLTPLAGLANVYLQQQQLDRALETTKEIIKVQEQKRLEKDLLISYNRMGLIYSKKKAYDLSIANYQKSLDIATRLRSVHVPYIHSNLSEAYEYNGQYKEALEHADIFYGMRDSIDSEEFKIKTQELLTQYETAKKEKEIALLKKEQKLRQVELEKEQELYKRELLKKELEEQENKYKLLQRNREIGLLKKDREIQEAKIENKQIALVRQTYIRNIAIGCAILIFIATIIIMVVYQQKVRNQELLTLKTEEVNKQKTLELLRSFEIKTIRASIEGQEKEKHRIARELHDGVAGTLAGIKMRFQALGKVLEENEQLQGMIRSLDEVYREVRTISHHLSPPGMLQYSFVEFIRKYLNEISGTGDLEIEYIFHGKEKLNRLSDDIKVEVYRILQELITNVIKHAKANFVEVQLMKEGDELSLLVEDRGKGFEMQTRPKGMGLSSINSRVEGLGGKLMLDSMPGRGTMVHVHIPVKEHLTEPALNLV